MNDLSPPFYISIAPVPFVLRHDGLYSEIGRGKHRYLARICGWLRVVALARDHASNGRRALG